MFIIYLISIGVTYAKGSSQQKQYWYLSDQNQKKSIKLSQRIKLLFLKIAFQINRIEINRIDGEPDCQSMKKELFPVS